LGGFKQFASALQFGVWPGLAPSQKPTGGKACLARITKRGGDGLRTLMIHGAKSADDGQQAQRPHQPVTGAIG